ncbi:Deoxynucleoside triphosphate like protein [Argiope bruennichi]|uniref:Deoxynucleoside triphosphate like protein n=1 Tax=Argiope bruennichi TaxID=94029 RepID=A0A8T0ECY4_ARGBR|nr:Deoxynucleoside triphosphate like protein [Argiope bruennichi]
MSLMDRNLDIETYDYNGCHSLRPHAKKLKSASFSAKIFCDPVHGQISLHPACVAIIDTPQFQRLRAIKQTGFLEYVYPGATHNRFSHSLGVCYLAGKFIQELRERQPELLITDTDVLCVQLAGLCHDLGHGPFSHTWERYIHMATLKKNLKTAWKHEIVSINMLDYLIEDNNLLPQLKKFGIGSKEINIIKEFIQGSQPVDGSRAFLYQIVNNDDSGLDVDKWDYFLRDCHYLGLPCSFEYERLIQFAKVFMVDGKSQICFRDKVLESVYNVFRTRSNLHRLAYQHKVCMITERMFLDAFLIVDGKCTGPTGETLHFWDWSMSAAYSQGENLKKALERYCTLTDSVIFFCLKYASQPDVKKAADIVKAIEKRSSKANGFYQHVGLKILPYFVSEADIANGFCQLLPAANERVLSLFINGGTIEKNIEPVNSDDICICVVPVNWGKGDKNPVESVLFYSKDSVFTNHSSDISQVSAMLPKSFQEIQVHVLCRRSDDYASQVARWCFENYWDASPIKRTANSLKNNCHL